MLHLAGGVGLGVDVADLLELQGPLVGGGHLDVPPQEEEVLGLVVLFGDVGDEGPLLQDLLHQAGKLFELPDQGPGLLLAQGAPGPAEADGQHGHGRQHGHIGLGGGHADLRPGVDVEDRLHLPGEARALGVDDPQGPGPLALGLPQALQGVNGLPGLADGHGQGLSVHHRVPVAVLAGHVPLHGDPGEALQEVFPVKPGVGRRPAGHHVDPVHLQGVQLQAQVHVPHLLQEPPPQGVLQDPGLFVDLLQHVVGKAPLLRRLEAPVHLHRLPQEGVPQEVRDLHPLPGDAGHVAVVEEDDLPRVGQKGGHVRGQKVLPLPQAHHQGAHGPGGHDLLVVLVHGHHGVGPPHLLQSLPEGFQEVAPVLLLYKVGQDLAVGVRAEAVAPGLQRLLEFQVVLNDAVVDHGDAPVLGGVGVGVGVGGGPVGGPAGVADAQVALKPLLP